MFTISNQFTQADIEQAVKLAKLYYTDLIQKYIRPHGPTGSLCSSQVEIEVREYMEEALYQHHGMRIEIEVARDTNTQSLIGFAVVLSSAGSPDCGLNYVAVHKDYRRQGIMKAMLKNIQNRYSYIVLSCNPSKVPYYENLGFVIEKPEYVQISMTWGTSGPNSGMDSFDMDKNVTLQEHIRSFETLNAKKIGAMMTKVRDAQMKRMGEVEAYYQSRVAGSSHDVAILLCP